MNKDNQNTLLKKEERNLGEYYTNLLYFEESFLKEKVRVRWMKEGDKNTQFFHRIAKSHGARNKILRLMNEQNIMIEDYEEIKKMVVDFFEHFFKEPNQHPNPILTWHGTKISDEIGSSRPQ